MLYTIRTNDQQRDSIMRHTAHGCRILIFVLPEVVYSDREILLEI